MRYLAASAILVLMAACGGVSKSPSKEGLQFQQELLSALTAADKLVALEHSWEYDVQIEGGDGLVPQPRRIYRRVELDGVAKASLISAVGSMDARMPEELAACIFSPHHTIQLYEGRELRSELQICYECADVKWTARNSVTPLGIVMAVTPTILAAGMQTERNWAELASPTASPK